jgi:hypothetical protein
MWPPSRNPIGAMLRRLIRKPAYASASRSRESWASPAASTTTAPTPPATGPASETRAFRHGLKGTFLRAT